ncbi:MAG: DUF5719 family protein [Bifidobacteriaceae bacterium]|nr:DUF5719 family protein [Bifidobacteriaceae bacterium]
MSEHMKDDRNGGNQDSEFDFTQTMAPVTSRPHGEADASGHDSTAAQVIADRHHAAVRTAATTVAAAVSAILLVGVSAAAAIGLPFKSDGAAVTPASYNETVGQTQDTVYCPQRMTLADTASYGDSEFQVDEGDVASSMLVAATGGVSNFYASPMDSSAPALDVTAASASIAAATADESAFAQATLSSSTDLSALFGSVATWATDGDLTGLSATSCVVPATSQRIIVPSTETGWTEQLVLANPNTLPASVTITAWGTSQTGSLSLSTSASATVDGGEETVVNLDASAKSEKALVIDVDSGSIPLAAVVRSVYVDGLTPSGSDFAVPAVKPSTSLLIPGIDTNGDIAVTLFSQNKDADVSLTWLTEKGGRHASTVSLAAGRVDVENLGKAPDGAYALAVTSTVDISAQVVSTQSGTGQTDFAVADAVSASPTYGVAAPSDTSATLVLANASEQDIGFDITTYDASGEVASTQSVTVEGRTSQHVSMDGVAAVVTNDGADDGAGTAVAAIVTQKDVTAANAKGVAVVSGAPIDVDAEVVTSTRDQRIVS